MALKTVGRDYMLWPERDGVPRGIYYFVKYHECKGCAKKVHIYMDEYEAQEFCYNANPRLDHRHFWDKVKEKIPHLRLVVEKGSPRKKEEGMLGWH